MGRPKPRETLVEQHDLEPAGGDRPMIRQRVLGEPSTVTTSPVLSASSTNAAAVAGDFGLLTSQNVQMRAASVRGLSHQYGGTARQDAFAVTSQDDTIALAVCDGVGDAPHSHRGAHLAATVSARMILDRWAPEQVGDAIAARMCDEAAERGYAPENLASTLALVRVEVGAPREPWLVQVAQWGDSSLLILDTMRVVGGHPVWARACPRTQAGVVNEVSPLPDVTSPGAEARLWWRPGEVLVAVTDGIDLVLDSRNAVGHELASAWREPPEWPQFIADVAFDRAGARDDRSAVALWREPLG